MRHLKRASPIRLLDTYLTFIKELTPKLTQLDSRGFKSTGSERKIPT
jgi:hypothetical protein